MSNPFSRITKMQLAIMAFAALAALALPLRGRFRSARAAAQAPAPPPPPKMPSGGMAMPQTLVCPLWRMSPDLIAKIHIKNSLMVAPLAVTATLYMADGTPYQLPPVTIPMSGEATVNLNHALENAPPSLGDHVSSYGSASLTYMWDGAGHVSASTNMKDIVHSLSFNQAFLALPESMSTNPGSMAAFTGYERRQERHLRTVLASYHPLTPGARQNRQPEQVQTPPLHGLWWKRDPGVRGYFALSNASGAPLTARYRLSGSGGAQSGGGTVELPPHASLSLPLEPLIAALPPGPRGERKAGGISVRQLSGEAMALGAAGWLENDAEGYSASIEFQPGYEPQPASVAPGGVEAAAANGQIVLAATGLMLGRPMAGEGFPGRLRFRPYGYLRNATRRPLRVGIVVNVAPGAMAMPGTTGPQPVSESFVVMLAPGALAPVALAQLAHRLEARLASTMGVSVGSLEGAMLNWSASFDGHDGDVLMTTGSTDQSGNYVFEVMPNSVGPEVGLQMPYWNTYGGNDTMYSLWNPGATAQSVVLTLYSADGMHTYAIPVTLAPDASTMVDVGMLRQEGMPDPSGNLLPPGVEDGSAMLEPAAAGKPGKNGIIKVPASGPAEMEVAVSMGIFNAQTATCCTCCTSCCVYTCPAVEDGLGLVGVGQALAATMTAEDCCGILEDFTDAATWSDNNGAVLASQGAGAFNALGVGSATLTAEAYLIAGSGTCNGKCHSTLAAPTAQGAVKPKILVGLDGKSPSTDITNGSQSVLAGEEVQLEADTGSTSASSAAWTIADGPGGSHNGGWSVSTATGLPQLTSAPTSGATITVYWAAANSANVSVSVAGVPSSATVNVAGPSVTASATEYNWATNSGWLMLGGYPQGPGIYFTASDSSTPHGATDNFIWEQVLTNFGETHVNSSIGNLNCSMPVPASDSDYPYGSGTSTSDAPGLEFLTGDSEDTYTIGADMYLLWHPGLPGDIPVPLGYFSWAGKGDASLSGSTWSVLSDSTPTPGSNPIPVSFSASTAYPNWGSVDTPANNLSCQGAPTQLRNPPPAAEPPRPPLVGAPMASRRWPTAPSGGRREAAPKPTRRRQ